MMDEQFKEQLEILKRGTQWRELKSSARRSVGFIGTKSQINSLLLKNLVFEKVRNFVNFIIFKFIIFMLIFLGNIL